jgi:predicted PolB exonuclease-like 3'-5' exonuclease
MDVLAAYQPRAVARLDDIATMLGFPGKMGMDGSKVWDNFQAGEIEGIRNYCETDVLNTYLVYQRFELIRGRISASQYEKVCEQVRTELEQENKPHLNEFLQNWQRE